MENGEMENEVSINLQLYQYQIKQKVIYFFKDHKPKRSKTDEKKMVGEKMRM